MADFDEATFDELVRKIAESGATIYDLHDESSGLLIEDRLLEALLRRRLFGLDLNYPNRTKSKILKAKICEALGYPVPRSFRRTRPRFLCQNFDTCVQKSDNVQIYNEVIDPSRRYVIVRVDATQLVTGVRVVTGALLSALKARDTLTLKFQAKSLSAVTGPVLGSGHDTTNVIKFMQSRSLSRGHGSLAEPTGLLPIAGLFELFCPLIGTRFADPGVGQERNRGAALHRVVCQRIGGSPYGDSGQFPDIPSQLLEVKLQTSTTIDLGLVSPDSDEPLIAIPPLVHRDVRYAVFYGAVDGHEVILQGFILSTGADFFQFFRKFAGKTQNSKRQIRLPRNFFDDPE